MKTKKRFVLSGGRYSFDTVDCAVDHVINKKVLGGTNGVVEELENRNRALQQLFSNLVDKLTEKKIVDDIDIIEILCK